MAYEGTKNVNKLGTAAYIREVISAVVSDISWLHIELRF
jgi:hypothetical protein